MSPKKLLSNFICLGLLSCFFSISAQVQSDSIQKKSFEEIRMLINSVKKLEKRIFFTEFYVAKAKKENNHDKLVFGYHTMIYLHSRLENGKNLQYADSIILLTNNNSNETYPALAYQFKGDYYLDTNQYKKALKNYLWVSHFAKKHNNKDWVFRANLNIGNLKWLIGKYDEALEVFQENFSFIQIHKDSLPYDYSLAAIASLSDIFNERELPDSAAFYNALGAKEAKILKDTFYSNHFKISQGITSYYRKDYSTAIDSLEKYTHYFEKNKNTAALYVEDLSLIYFFSGESYFQINNEKKAIEYFKKVDSIFEETKFIFPKHRVAYTRLIDYYKKKNDLKNRLLYVTQLIKVDSILHANESAIDKEIIKKYDVPKLKAQKEAIEKELKAQKRISKSTIIILSILFCLSTIGFIFQYKKRRLYRKRFDQIINDLVSKEKKQVDQNHTEEEAKQINIPSDIIDNILKELDVFEKKHQFTSNEITLNFLAKKLKTNPNYLSKVINHYKKTSFSQYLNELRVKYAIEQLNSNQTYRKYTIKAISIEVGFNTAQSFTRAFYKSKGIYPSYFIKQLQKMES